MATDFQIFIQKLKNSLKQELPGIAIQYEMAPVGRDRKLSAEEAALLKESAVIALLFPEKEKIKLMFMKRVSDDTVHSGQISFPGGGKESEDKNLEETAVRELEEETGVSRDTIEIIGRLTPLPIKVSGYNVQPFVAYCNETPDIKSNEEVEKIIKTDLEYLLTPDAKTGKIINVRNEKLKVPCFIIDNEVLWGATAMMTNELLEIIKRFWRDF